MLKRSSWGKSFTKRTGLPQISVKNISACLASFMENDQRTELDKQKLWSLLPTSKVFLPRCGKSCTMTLPYNGLGLLKHHSCIRGKRQYFRSTERRLAWLALCIRPSARN